MSKKSLIFSLFFVSLLFTSTTKGQGILYFKAGFLDDAKPLLISEIKSDPANNAEEYFYLGNIYFNQNKPDSAEICFKNGLAADPTYSQNQVGLIMLRMKNDPQGTDLELKNLLKLKQNKKNVDLYIAISYAYLYNNMEEKALYYQSKARGINSKYAGVYVLLGDILAPKNRGEACSNYELANLYDPNNKEAYIKYARAYKSVNPKLSIDKLKQLKEKDPSFALVDRELGDIYYSINDFENAAHYYESYIQSGISNVQDLTKYSMTLFMNHEFQKSLEVATMGLQKDPLNPAFNRLIMYNNVELKQNEAALSAADVLFNKSRNPEFNYLDFIYYGQALRDTKQTALAIEQYKKALQYDSTKVDLWKDISDMYNEIGDYANAIDAYVKFMNSLSDKDRNADIIIALGKLYYSYGNDPKTAPDVKKSALLKADSIFAKIAELEPDGYRGNFWRARANSALDPETTLGLAKPFYESTAALIESKNDPRFNSVLIECYSYLGYYTLVQKDYEKSLQYWDKILKIDPNNATAKKAIEGIKPQKKNEK
jgi:tetratricopeptide (TPR) repeat protein